MLEHSVYSVISPEGCASILWRDADKARDAAAALRLTAQDLLSLDVVDRVVDEPLGGSHRDKEATFQSLGDAIEELLSGYDAMKPDEIRNERREKFLEMGRRKLD